MIWIVLTSCVLNLYSTFAGKYFVIYLELNGFFCSLIKSLTEVHFYYEMFFFIGKKNMPCILYKYILLVRVLNIG